MPEEDYLQKKYESLPEDLKKALFDQEIANKIYRWGINFNIPKEKMKLLAQIVGKVFLGIINLNNLKEELQNNLEISPENTEGLYQGLYNDVFLKYKENLENLTKKTEVSFSQNFPEEKELVPEKIEKTPLSFQEKSIPKEEEPLKPSTEEELLSPSIEEENLKEINFDRYREPIEEDEEKEEKEEKEVMFEEENNVNVNNIKEAPQEKPKFEENIKEINFDKYREPIEEDEEKEKEKITILKDEGRIKKLF